MSLAITFWGVRGSIPTPGPATARYGGNTACLSVESGGALLVLDAGSGIRRLGRALTRTSAAKPLSVDLLLSHTHWDHIQGFPFFAPLLRPGDAVRVYGPAQPGASVAAVLQQQMAPHVFPVPLSAVRASLAVRDLADPELELPGFLVRAVHACHPAPTLGYSIEPAAGGARLVYLTDNELHRFGAGTARAGLVRFVRHAHTLVHDAMYSDAEVDQRRGWGHSAATEAVALAAEAGCRRLVLFHHDPDHDDAALERLLEDAMAARERLGVALELTLATEGVTLHLED